MKYLIYILLLLSNITFANVIDTVPNTMNLGHVSSEWEGQEYADPSAAITFINPPNANITGNANLSFPIQVPVGRQGLQPELSVSYDSEETNTWLGYGWNIGLSSITLDTRWGVPLFLDETESEIYLLDGEQMGPVFHRAAEYPREAERTFFLRQTTDFQKIIRHGDAPDNYWWEVIEKDGLKKYYGGFPTLGESPEHIMKGNDGITHWMLAKIEDSNGNNMMYNYQIIDGASGKNIYPSNIIYTGHENDEGNYSVHFFLQSETRSDVTFSARLGYLQSEERLLNRVEVRFKSEQIRAYTFTYKTGFFGKTLLQDIKVYDQNDAFFYDYEFEYFDDISENGNLSAYGPEVEWSVSKDNVAIGNITGNIEGFNAKPTLLGSALSKSIGGSASVTIGFVSPPNTKDLTAGPNGGYTNNDSEGLTALIDIDGDGLPDKVWKEENGIYYRSNQLTGPNPTASFGDKIKIEGVDNFNLSNTQSWNLGAELNLPPVYAGYTHEEGTTNTSTYFVDFNGDEFIDIVNEGKVYFNHLENGIPVFSEEVSLTPSVIYKGEPLDPDIITFDPNEQAEQENQNPLHDAVRAWRAPFTGFVQIEAPVNLIEDNSPESISYLTKDGVRVSIQAGSQVYWEEVIAADDFSTKVPTNVGNIPVTEGEFVYFRVHSIADGSYDEVNWDPIISYIDGFENDDANALAYGEYKASEDFLLSDEKSVLINQDGIIEISNEIFKPFLSDDIVIKISGAYNYEWSMDMNEEIDSILVLDNISVVSGDELSFTISSTSNVDWTKFEWAPVIQYSSFTDGSPTTNDDGSPVVNICAPLDYQGYFINENRGETIALPAAESVDLQLSFLDIGFGLSYNVSVKLKGATDTTLIFPGIISVFNTIINIEGYDQMMVDVNYSEDDNFIAVELVSSSILSSEGEEIIQCGIWADRKIESGQYGHLYRGWGQFLYNGNDGRGVLPINLEELEIDEDEAAQDTSIVNENSGSTEIEGAGNGGELIIAMTSDSKLLAWRGSDEFAFVSAGKMGSSRKGKKYITTGIFNPGAGDKFTSPDLITKYYSNGGFGGLGVPGTPVSGSAGYTAATSYSVLDIADFNGDRYPDVISETTIQYTDFRGGLTNTKFSYDWGIHESFSEAFSIGVGLNPGSTSAKNSGSSMGTGSNKSTSRVRQRGRSNAGKARSAFESASEAVGLSANVGSDEDHAIHTFLDINGDALEDKVWENGDVAINLGYGFAPIENWGFNSIRSGDALDFGAGVGINISNGSILGGVSATKTDNASKTGFIDLNGDALLDMIVSTDPLMVRFNTGRNFTPPVNWMDLDAFDMGVSLGESANAGFTFSLIFFWFKISFNIQGFVGQGSGTIYDSFQDINGDGYPDYLSAESSDDNLKARYSTIGRTNLLKTVHYPLGAELTLDYKVIGNTSDLPFSKWTLSESIMYDGLEGDGSDYTQSKFSYENGFHDRHDRQFMGFQQVKTSDYSGERIVKELVQTYHVDNYYMKGLVAKIELYDGQENLHKSIQFSYALRDIESGTLLPADYITKDDGMAFPSLSQQSTLYTEGTTDKLVQVNSTFEYDALGNITRQVETDNNDYYKESVWTYKTDFINGISNRITTERIFDSNELLRKTEYVYDNKGNKIEIKSSIDANSIANTNLEYDVYGNVVKTIKPENEAGERYELTYSYEQENFQFPILTFDSYGYTESRDYELLYGTITSFTDYNDNTTLYGVDSKGRPDFILHTMDADAGKDYSKKYEYFPDATTPYAICKHAEPTNLTDITTHAFVDGKHRVVQTKLPALISINGSEQLVLIVSGQNTIDSLGRVVKEYQVITELLNAAPLYNSDTSMVKPIQYTYDLNDRILSIINIDGGETKIDYDISLDLGESLLVARQTNPNGLITDLFYSSREELLAERTMMPTEISLTTYQYDALSSLLTISHPSGSETKYSYDLLGRRITVDVPDAGITRLEYDKASNLVQKITANIREGLQENASIRYSYEKERLVSIDYPKNFQNRVQLFYGEAGALHNRAGRIWLQQDGTGGREFFYDVYGNLTKEIRTIIVNRSEIYTYVTEFEHDAFNRINKIIYPDGESLNYAYDISGRLDAISGTKANDEYVYVKNLYFDQYLEMIKADLGNELQELKEYDDKGRIVAQVINQNSNPIYDASIVHDLEDNVLTFQNSISDDFLGAFEIKNSYDEKNRLTDSEGLWNSKVTNRSYDAFFDYNPTNTLSMKGQELKVNDEIQSIESRNFDYVYENTAYPTRPSEVAGRAYHYDLNGNLSLVNSQTIFDFSQYIYDEENRMMGASINGQTSLYTYDAFGRRAIKSQGSIEGVFINGAPAGLIEHTKQYQVEVSPYFTVYEHGYRKHIYMGKYRILSKIGTGVFNTNLSEVPLITAGSLDYKQRIQDYEQQILQYYADRGVPPGPPTLLAILGQPEFNQIGFQDLNANNPYNTIPPNWPLISEPNTTGPPGMPVFYTQSGINNDHVEAGYNFSNGQITKELEQFYYHYDQHLNVNLVTGSDGLIRQHKMYLPSGELWLSKHKFIDSSSYTMAGLLLDDETGLYYMGEVYYDPVSNVELSVDKLEQTFGINTLDSRIEGNLYYDYADYQDNVDFDLQIINSEKPDPFLAGPGTLVDFTEDDDDGIIIDFTKDFDAFTDEQTNPFTGKSSDEVKKRRRAETLSPGSQNSETFSEVFEAFETANLQSPEGFNPSDAKAFKTLRKQADKNKMRKKKLQQRKKNNTLKVKIRVK